MNGDEPAFPINPDYIKSREQLEAIGSILGLSRRDYFAIRIYSSILSNSSTTKGDEITWNTFNMHVANFSVQQADALIEALNKPK